MGQKTKAILLSTFLLSVMSISVSHACSDKEKNSSQTSSPPQETKPTSPST